MGNAASPGGLLFVTVHLALKGTLMNHHPASTPDYVTDAIPGARELANEYARLRTANATAADTMRRTGEAASAITTPNLHEPLRQPMAGVKRADWDKALDAYRVAQDELRAAESALDRAARRFSVHIDRGRSTPEFKAKYTEVGAAAQRDAAEKLTALRAAIATRDTVNQWMGRRVKDPTAHGVSYTLGQIAEYVSAVPTAESHFREKALEAMAAQILMPGDRARHLRVIEELNARDDLPDAQKLAAYRARTGRVAE